MEFAPEYENLRACSERATEQSTFHFNKKRALAADLRALQESKQDADAYDGLVARQAKLEREVALLTLGGLEERMREIREQMDRPAPPAADGSPAAGLEAAKQGVQECRREVATRTKELQRAQKQKDALSRELEDLRLAKAKLAEGLKLAGRRRAKAAEAATKTDAEAAQLRARLTTLQTDHAALRATLATGAQERASVLELTDAQMHEYNALNDAVALATREPRKAMDALHQQLSGPRTTCHYLGVRVSEREEALEELRTTKALVAGQVQEAQARMKELAADKAAVELERRAAEQELARDR
jgi:structural maintenance of chromosome 1